MAAVHEGALPTEEVNNSTPMRSSPFPGRGATTDGSRGFQPTVTVMPNGHVAERRLNRSIVAPRQTRFAGIRPPWVETHGYRQLPLRGKDIASTLCPKQQPMTTRSGRRFSAWLGWPSLNEAGCRRHKNPQRALDVEMSGQFGVMFLRCFHCFAHILPRCQAGHQHHYLASQPLERSPDSARIRANSSKVRRGSGSTPCSRMNCDTKSNPMSNPSDPSSIGVACIISHWMCGRIFSSTAFNSSAWCMMA